MLVWDLWEKDKNGKKFINAYSSTAQRNIETIASLEA